MLSLHVLLDKKRVLGCGWNAFAQIGEVNDDDSRFRIIIDDKREQLIAEHIRAVHWTSIIIVR